ncbi:MAG: hypothetical protein MRJ93_05225 [Nitrososphaeraceae archaeon]|nr:hypothetical protein [Nitrososphaeraceae archaeon]
MKELSDIRVRTIILTLLSSGVRVGALTDLKLRELTYLEEHKIYKISVYSEEIAYHYITFCTPECAITIKLYLDYREKKRENLPKQRPFIATSFHIKRSKDSFVTRQAIQKILDRERYKAGIFSQERDAQI